VKADVVLGGVGGQGVLTIAALLANAARDEGLDVRQGEVHGMSQRGGAVQATLRMSDAPIRSGLIPRGGADLVLGLEPVEALRYLPYLAADGRLVTAADPVENIPSYPDIEAVRAEILRVPGAVLVEALALAAESGSRRSANVVMVGAASPFLPLRAETLEAAVAAGFAPKGERIVAANLAAFRAGRAAAETGAGV
jgi:indolepyruvate ferredoxin oxidoreductase beta subunit